MLNFPHLLPGHPTSETAVAHHFFDKHRAMLDRALQAIAERGYWSAYPGVAEPAQLRRRCGGGGEGAFDVLRDQPFDLDSPAPSGSVGRERSPYGFDLGITYPKPDVDALFAAVAQAQAAWRKAGPEAWVGVSLEILERINKASFLIAHAVMHTTGQAFMMAFQAGGPHAQDRGLEAVAYAWDEMRRIPAKAQWEKPQGKNEPLRMEKHSASCRAASRWSSACPRSPRGTAIRDCSRRSRPATPSSSSRIPARSSRSRSR